MRYKSLFHQSPIYYQLAKSLSVSVAELGDKQCAELLFFTTNLLGQCDVNGHAAIHLCEYANQHAFVEHDIQFRFPNVASWKESLLASACTETFLLPVSSVDSCELLTLLQQLERSDKPLCLIDDVLYLSKTAFIELSLAQQFIQRSHQMETVDAQFLSSPLLPTGQFELLNDMHQADDIDWQEVAVNNSVLSRLSFIVGGPGTGKTTTVAKIVERLFQVSQFYQQPLNIAFAAPTGKAAARLHSALVSNLAERLSADQFTALSKSLPDSASTLHRLLGWHAGHSSFKFDTNHKLPFNCIIVDEVSMIDTSMFYYLLRAVESGCRLILLGDPQQLASVQSGSVLSDLCDHDALMYFSEERSTRLNLGSAFSLDKALPPLIDNIAFLRKSYRFDEQSGIGQVAKACQMGDIQRLYQAQSAEVQLLEKSHFDSQQQVLTLAFEQHTNIIECAGPEQALACLSAFQILCAKREGDDSVEAINRLVSQRINLAAKVDMIAGHQVYHGMPVIIQKNLYQQGLFNGDIGIAWRDALGQLAFYFASDDLVKCFMPSQLSGWQAAHAMTVHKSQGSEYKTVVLWMPDAHSPLLNKELFYTAVTRAKTQFICMTDKAAVEVSLNNSTTRFSKLTQLMQLYGAASPPK